MTEDKKKFLQDQMVKIEEVLSALNRDFQEEFEDEKNFLAIVCDNLKEEVTR
jgi:hypothetical protein